MRDETPLLTSKYNQFLTFASVFKQHFVLDLPIGLLIWDLLEVQFFLIRGTFQII